MHRDSLILAGLVLCLSAAGVLSGCQALRELAALKSVEFGLDRVSDARLADIDMERLRSYEDLSASEAVRLIAAASSGELPLEFTLHVAARNPPENPVQARLERLEWTLLLEETETISGVVEGPVVILPGDIRYIPVRIELDLVTFFERNARDLIDLALAAAGGGGDPQNVTLQAVPTIDTPLGRIAYPEPITIVSRDFGRSSSSPSS
ncbi:MAG: hypothetical protein WD021_02045 [Rhodothermales bacterium]